MLVRDVSQFDVLGRSFDVEQHLAEGRMTAKQHIEAAVLGYIGMPAVVF